MKTAKARISGRLATAVRCVQVSFTKEKDVFISVETGSLNYLFKVKVRDVEHMTRNELLSITKAFECAQVGSVMTSEQFTSVCQQLVLDNAGVIGKVSRPSMIHHSVCAAIVYPNRTATPLINAPNDDCVTLCKLNIAQDGGQRHVILSAATAKGTWLVCDLQHTTAFQSPLQCKLFTFILRLLTPNNVVLESDFHYAVDQVRNLNHVHVVVSTPTIGGRLAICARFFVNNARIEARNDKPVDANERPATNRQSRTEQEQPSH